MDAAGCIPGVTKGGCGGGGGGGGGGLSGLPDCGPDTGGVGGICAAAPTAAHRHNNTSADLMAARLLHGRTRCPQHFNQGLHLLQRFQGLQARPVDAIRRREQ